MVVDENESELGVLDLIQVLVETLDRFFKNVCELDVIFNSEQVRVDHDVVCRGGHAARTRCMHAARHSLVERARQGMGPRISARAR